MATDGRASAAFLPQEVIRRKRDGESLKPEEIAAMVAGIADQSVGEGQAAAFAMAVFFQGMDRREGITLTQCMRDSGTVLDWSKAGFDGPVLDKHSTGGVGDKVSLMLGPMVAAAGGYVPMISGRGLGHTGGTLDKLDAIPGYNSQPDRATFRRVVADTGCAIIGQTDDLAPADRRLYGIRDVTATVESIPLITASILSKKLAAGLEGLVMDVKCGSGGFVAGPAEAQALAENIVAVANNAGMKTTALITDMNQVLGRSAGNAVEVLEAVQFLKADNVDADLLEVTVALTAEILLTGGLTDSLAGGRGLAAAVLANGAAVEVFGKMVAALGGPADFVAKPEKYLPAAKHIEPVFAPRAGQVTAIEVRQVGIAVVALGGGRRRAEDTVDASVGLTEIAGLGETVDGERPLALVHAANKTAALAAAASLQAAFRIGNETVTKINPILQRIGEAKETTGE